MQAPRHGEAVVLRGVDGPHRVPVGAVAVDNVAHALLLWQRGNVALAERARRGGGGGGGGIGALRVDLVDFTVVVVVHGHRGGDVVGVVDREAEEQLAERVWAVARGSVVAVDGQLDGGGRQGVEAPGLVEDDDELPRRMRVDERVVPRCAL